MIAFAIPYLPFFFNGSQPPLVANPSDIFDQSGGCACILPGEQRTFAFDFTGLLAPGDALDASAPFAWAATTVVGVDTAPSECLVGGCQLIGAQLLQRLTGEIVGNTYTMLGTAQTLNGDTLKMWFNLEIVAPGCTTC
jgi:hypothetical protein